MSKVISTKDILLEIIQNDYNLPKRCPECGGTEVVITQKNPSLFFFDMITKKIWESVENYSDNYLELTIVCANSKCNHIFCEA